MSSSSYSSNALQLTNPITGISQSNSSYSFTSSFANTVQIQGPYLNQSGATYGQTSTQTCINQLSAYLIADVNTSTSTNMSPFYYFKAVASFMLLGSVLDSAPASANVTDQVPNIAMTINNVGLPSPTSSSSFTTNATSNYLVQLTLSAGGRNATTPIFQTQTLSGSLTFILSNYFQISAPGVLYTVTCEANALTNTSLFPL